MLGRVNFDEMKIVKSRFSLKVMCLIFFLKTIREILALISFYICKIILTGNVILCDILACYSRSASSTMVTGWLCSFFMLTMVRKINLKISWIKVWAYIIPMGRRIILSALEFQTVGSRKGST